MAVIDQSKINKPFVVDRDENINIGIDFPFRVGQDGTGWGASTKTTLDAVANNLRNLVSTEMGERLMQPNLGIALRKFLFEQFNADVVEGVKAAIIESVSYWLPFINISNINVKMSEIQNSDFRNTMDVSIEFYLKKDPTTQESIQVTIGE